MSIRREVSSDGGVVSGDVPNSVRKKLTVSVQRE